MNEPKLRRIIREQIKQVISEQSEPKMELSSKSEDLMYSPTGTSHGSRLYRRIEFMDGRHEWKEVPAHPRETPYPVDEDEAEELERVYQNQIA